MTIYTTPFSFVNIDSFYKRPTDPPFSPQEPPFASYDPNARILCVWENAIRGLVSHLSEISALLAREVSRDGELAALIHTLSKAPAHPFSEIECLSGIGGGIYAIYYVGEFPNYQKISASNSNNKFNEPIYIGKTVKGTRKGGLLTKDRLKKSALLVRMRAHQKSIIAATNLNLDDFYYRIIVCNSAPVANAEEMLIAHYQPLWNCKIDGFGGDQVFGNTRSLWDTLHPGRPRAAAKADRKRPPPIDDLLLKS